MLATVFKNPSKFSKLNFSSPLFTSLQNKQKKLPQIRKMVTVQQALQDDRLKHYVTPDTVPVVPLVVEEAFKELNNKEKKYAHFISQASWAGTKIVLRQASLESPAIFDFLQSFFRPLVALDGTVTASDIASKIGADEKDLNSLIQYAAMFYGNMGNYKSFGDSKFIPRLEAQALTDLVNKSGNNEASDLLRQCIDKMYSLDGLIDIDFGNTGYYNCTVSKEDAELVQGFLEQQNISAYNTALYKTKEGFDVVLASASTLPTKEHDFNGKKIRIVYGGYQKEMSQVVENLKLAKENALNQIESDMMDKYIESFDKGSIEAHKDSQRFWIRDVGPIVESNIGFIESYRDPLKVRGEWEGFVAVVNKETTKKFNALVNNAEFFIGMLPWNDNTKGFEKDKFQRPDFTSLEVVTFASSGIPAGINIPNYDDIRQDEGFKNVSLGNVLNAPASKSDDSTFLKPEDKEPFTELKGKAFEVQVGLHELLGHGSGKLLSATDESNSTFNYDKNLINPLTNAPVDTFYKFGETYPSKFGGLQSSWEECRAEAVGIYLCVRDEVLKIFGFEGELAEQIVYVNWLNMVRAGLLGLEFYSPESKKWGQAHMHARHAILRVLLNAGEGLVRLEDKEDDIVIHLDRTKIKTVGLKAMHHFLLQLSVLKSVADSASAQKLFDSLTSVDEQWTKRRNIVLEKKKPRRVFVQVHTELVGDNVELKSFEANEIGLIKSFLTRFK